MKLTDTFIRNTKPGDRALKHFDGAGMFLLITPSGQRWWRFKYRFEGKEKLLALGVYPAVTLRKARERCEDARRQLADGIDPGAQRKAHKLARQLSAEHSFESVAREWLESKDENWTPKTKARIAQRLAVYVYPVIGKRPVADIQTPEITALILKVQGRGIVETAHRVYQDVRRVFRFAIGSHRAVTNPAAQVMASDVLKPIRPKHHAALTVPKDIGALLRAIQGYQGHPIACAALRLLPYVFVRPGELRHATWGEFDLQQALWRIPGSRMKMGRDHLVPLANQAVELLEGLRTATGKADFVFPSIRTNRRPMSENTLNAALRRLGYSSDEMTSHGFRSMASTMLNEQDWHRDAIERQLAHAESDAVRAAYNRAEHLPERRKMMQAWADYLDALRDGADVVPLQRKG